MLETALRAFTTFFATIGPVEAAVLFATLTPKKPRRARAAHAQRATVHASANQRTNTRFGPQLTQQHVIDLLRIVVSKILLREMRAAFDQTQSSRGGAE